LVQTGALGFGLTSLVDVVTVIQTANQKNVDCFSLSPTVGNSVYTIHRSAVKKRIIIFFNTDSVQSVDADCILKVLAGDKNEVTRRIRTNC